MNLDPGTALRLPPRQADAGRRVPVKAVRVGDYCR